MSDGTFARPPTVVLLYAGWQVWDGQYQPVRVGSEITAAVEFVQRSTQVSADPSSTPRFDQKEDYRYDATARVLENVDTVVLDLGAFRAVRRVLPGGSDNAFTPGDTVSLELGLGLDAWENVAWAHRWQVERIVRVTVGSNHLTDIATADMETVESLDQYCLLHCTLIR